MSTFILDSILTCPRCGFSKQETMPTMACQFYYECTNCKAVLRPKSGDCCVYCSYGSQKCPSRQEQHACCDRPHHPS
ncbi:MAG TPA: GDCCVxC domain-containing (seleno)protein [Burkholderiaceae bacterium]|nr:GDCCVxC domain-containing (seleno)protein [Burkholderiaceae bacterium]